MQRTKDILIAVMLGTNVAFNILLIISAILINMYPGYYK